MNFFISDLHLGHFNIVRYCNRPFTSLEEMDNTILNNINSTVAEDDTLFYLGDFCLSKSSEAETAPVKAYDYYRNKINCKNIIFIAGNHDNRGNGQCKSSIESIVIKHGGKRIFLTHDPKYYRKDFEWNFTGHLHGKLDPFRRMGKSIIVDLSVENWNYKPVNINDIMQAYAYWSKKNG